MAQYLEILGLIIFVFIIMGIALQFSKYKKKSTGCCGTGHCSNDSKPIPTSKSCDIDKIKSLEDETVGC